MDKRDRALVTWASVIPDVDGFGIVAEWVTRGSNHPLEWWTRYHHVLGHNIGFAILASIGAAILAKQRVKTASLVCVSFHLHLLGDLIGARGPDGDQWPIPYLLPFSRHVALTWPGQWALNAWPNFAITGALLGMTLILARQRGFFPLEMFSSKADAVFVQTLRSRFPLRTAE